METKQKQKVEQNSITIHFILIKNALTYITHYNSTANPVYIRFIVNPAYTDNTKI